MKRRVSLAAKILFLAFLNVALLAIVFLLFTRLQLRFDPTSLLLNTTKDRILSTSRLIALQLSNRRLQTWNALLARDSSIYPASFYLVQADGEQLAGDAVTLPAAVLEHIRRDPFAKPDIPPSVQAPFGGRRKPDGPVLLIHAGEYWAAAHVPIWMANGDGPIHATVVWRFSSLWTNRFFFDFRPWLAVGLIVVFISGLCWWPFLQNLARSISQLTRATAEIAEGRFDVDLKTKRRDELGQLAESVRRMTVRLEGLVNGQKRFLGDIAHELSSPIARMQLAIAILEERAAGSQGPYVADLNEEVQHMSSLVNELLSFSKAEIAGATDVRHVNVSAAVTRAIEREAPPGVSVEVDVPQALDVLAEPEYLVRSLSNLLRNAIRYAGDAGPILVSATNGDGMVSITVSDHGPGLPESQLESIFQPFYRLDSARQRETGGVGLGLAIVRSCIEACRGTVACRNRMPTGLQVEVRLPAA